MFIIFTFINKPNLFINLAQTKMNLIKPLLLANVVSAVLTN